MKKLIIFKLLYMETIKSNLIEWSSKIIDYNGIEKSNAENFTDLIKIMKKTPYFKDYDFNIIQDDELIISIWPCIHNLKLIERIKKNK